jgi:hypothetical protein
MMLQEEEEKDEVGFQVKTKQRKESSEDEINAYDY